jgi:hypothetical protein
MSCAFLVCLTSARNAAPLGVVWLARRAGIYRVRCSIDGSA